jgi:ribosome-associated translation inhibitor RaiA
MRYELRAPKVSLTAGMRSVIDTRLRRALGRFRDWIRDVEVVVTDVNGPRGGVDKQCRVIVRTGDGKQVVGSERHATLEGAVSRAVERAAKGTRRRRRAFRDPRRLAEVY